MFLRMRVLGLCLALILNCAVLVITKSYYSVIAPGVIKSNRRYTVAVSLHEANEPATINVRVEGPFYYSAQDVYLQPYQTKSVAFQLPKLAEGPHKLIAEGRSGIEFRNESNISPFVNAGPKIYIQTDKAIYKPRDEVQFRIVLLDEHTRPVEIKEPIRVEIIDNNNNRIKQFKDISLVKGVYKGRFQISQYPAMGYWKIKVFISGKYDISGSKSFVIKKYVLPKFSVYIKTDGVLLLEDGHIKALVYGKYTFDKYVEGNLTATVLDPYQNNKLLQQKQLIINDTAAIAFSFQNSSVLKNLYGVDLKVELTEKHTGLTRSAQKYFVIRKQRYDIQVDYDSVKYRYYKPYFLKARVHHWNLSPVQDSTTPIIMQHGSKEYDAYLNDNGEATFEFEHERDADYKFRYKNSTYTLPNIYADESLSNNETVTYCRLRLKGDRPRLGTKLEIEVSSIDNIPYLNYIIVGHANIIKSEHITVPPNQKVYVIEITPSIEMIPTSFIYVHYVQNGHLRYDELKLSFPHQFENQIDIVAPKQVKPGGNVTIELKAQPKSYVGLMAVDLAVYLLDSSYDLQRGHILSELEYDRTYIPIAALAYPGLLSGVVTLTNAHYPFLPKYGESDVKGMGPKVYYFRKKFPETWIFENYEITNETTRLSLTVPDSITTWRLTAFSVHDVTGFGIVNGPTDIIAIKSFFIILNLPYAVKRGEIVNIQILIYNYHNKSVEAEVTLYNEGQEFYFVDSNISNAEEATDERQHIKRTKVPAGGVEKVEFLINPKQVGDIDLQVAAVNPLSTDGLMQKLKVEPEGVVKHGNKALYTSIPTGGTFATTIAADIPTDIVPESEYLTLSVGGDSLVPTLKNLNDLVLLPTGCGEQNMVNFAPNILVLQYLKASGKYFKERNLVKKAKKFIEVGYQQQLSYRHANGGFSVFGERNDDEASTWLTAYVIRFFIKVSNYLPIEPRIIDGGLEYLAKGQFASGDFPFTGYLFYPAQQNRYGFTAFVLLTFLENEKYATKYQSTILKALTFLNKNLDQINDIYALSIVAMALQMAKHENAQEVIDKLKGHKRQKDDRMWWSQNDGNREKDVEITAYVLMGLLYLENDTTEDLNIHNWLIDQRNGRGGFKSTHDTVVGLQALVKFSEKYNQLNNINLKVQYSAKNNQSQVLDSGQLLVDANNQLILQTKELPPSTRTLDIRATGTGYSLMQFSYQYNMMTDNQFKHFQIQPKPMMPNADEMLLEICFSYQQSAETVSNASTTNMIIMEVNLPSGFTSNDEYSNELLENEIVQRIEAKNSETTIIIYFEKLSANIENCLNVMAAKISEVLRRKPAAIVLYDYYNISRHATTFYNV